VWWDLWKKRIHLAVLDFNNPRFYFLNRLKNLQLNISDDHRRAFVTFFASAVKGIIYKFRTFKSPCPTEMTFATCVMSGVMRIQAVMTVMILKNKCDSVESESGEEANINSCLSGLENPDTRCHLKAMIYMLVLCSRLQDTFCLIFRTHPSNWKKFRLSQSDCV
jgi:hypothetical protein